MIAPHALPSMLNTSTLYKCRSQSGIVLLLPHGLEGNGPEHSSARLERFLQLVDDDARELPDTFSRRAAALVQNFIVVNVTTPANYFHVLRRQLVRPFRKPLVVIAPKGLLRHRLVRSNLADFLPGTQFHPVLQAHSELSDTRRCSQDHLLLGEGACC